MLRFEAVLKRGNFPETNVLPVTLFFPDEFRGQKAIDTPEVREVASAIYIRFELPEEAVAAIRHGCPIPMNANPQPITKAEKDAYAIMQYINHQLSCDGSVPAWNQYNEYLCASVRQFAD